MSATIRCAALVLGLMLPATFAVGAAAAAAPCTTRAAGGDWPSYGHDAANTRSQPAEHALGPSAVSSLTPAWVFSTSSTQDGSAFNTTPVVSQGCVFIGSYGGVAYVLDARTGHVAWQRKLDAPNPGSGGVIVGAAAIDGNSVVFLVNEFTAPYAIALNRSTGTVVWKSPPFAPPLSSSAAQAGSYTNASPIVANGLVVAGSSPPEGDPTSSGGFSLIDAATGAIVKTTPTIPPADQAKGYAGGGLWSTPAYDPTTHDAYFGAGNPGNKDMQHPNTDAILKVDLDRSRATFGQIVASYQGNVDQYSSALQALSQTPACQVCNAASTAFDGSSIEGVGTPGDTAFSLARDTGATNWLSPIGDGIHYQSVSTADGVVWTVDGESNLDAFDAATGAPLLRRPLSVDARGPVANAGSPGVSIAEHVVFAAARGAGYVSTTGYVIVYRSGQCRVA